MVFIQQKNGTVGAVADILLHRARLDNHRILNTAGMYYNFKIALCTNDVTNFWSLL